MARCARKGQFVKQVRRVVQLVAVVTVLVVLVSTIESGTVFTVVFTAARPDQKVVRLQDLWRMQ